MTAPQVVTLPNTMTPLQERILHANFESVGPFYVSRDVHAMLDCACPSEIALMSEECALPADMEVPLSIPFNAKLREEFFGGILFDCDAHRHYMVNHDGYRLLKKVSSSNPTRKMLLQDAASASNQTSPELTLEAIMRRGLVGQVSNNAIKHFAARNTELHYLQAPSIVEVEVTYGCFRACRHCAYESSPEARLPNELSVRQWEMIFKKLAEAGVLILQLTGGDPLYRDDSFDIVEAAGEAGLSVYVRSDTVALSHANIERLKRVRGLWHVGTSIDGANSEMHDWMRGAGAFEILKERIKSLASEGIPIAAGATLHKNNFRTVRDIGRAATQFGAQWFDIGFLAPTGRGANLRDLILEEDEIVESLNMYLEGIQQGDYAPSHAHYLRRAQSNKPFEDISDIVGKLPYITEWPFSRLRIDPTGSTYTAGKLKGSDYAGGFNLLNNSVEHVWDNSPNLQALREVGEGRRIHSLDCRSLTTAYLFN